MQPTHAFEILVVDNEPPIYYLLTRIADKLFPEARFVNTRSAKETMNLLDQHPLQRPQLVLLDIDIHQAVDGLTLLPQLRSRFKDRYPRNPQLPARKPWMGAQWSSLRSLMGYTSGKSTWQAYGQIGISQLNFSSI